MSKSKGYIESLIEESVKVNNDNGLSKLDESKLRKAISSNKRTLGRNKDVFESEEKKFHTCKMYDPCPLCDKCRNKGSHLMNKCGTCIIPVCIHTYQDKQKMLRRKNFTVKSDALSKALQKYL